MRLTLYLVSSKMPNTVHVMQPVFLEMSLNFMI
jgi:hypothetical protein